MKIEIDVPDDRVRDFVERANIFAWAHAKDWNPEELRLVIVEHEDAVETVIGAGAWPAALKKMAIEYAYMFADVMNDDGDQWTGALLVQLAAFDEEKYV